MEYDSGCDDSTSVDSIDAMQEMLGFQLSDMSFEVSEKNKSPLYEKKNETTCSGVTQFIHGGEKIMEADKQKDEAINEKCDLSKLKTDPKYHIERIDVPQHCYREDNFKNVNAAPPTAFYIHDILYPRECQKLIDMAQNTPRGFQYIKHAVHTNPDGSTYTIPLMNPHPHKLTLFKDNEMLNLIWKRLEPILNQHLSQEFINQNGIPHSLNPRLRVLRYDARDNDLFAPHYDASTTTLEFNSKSLTNENQNKNDAINKKNTPYLKSQLTVLLYLNENFTGGRTIFLNRSDITRNPQPIQPKLGSILLFDHDLYHSGEPVKGMDGTKFILRTDVMFHSSNVSSHGIVTDVNDNNTSQINDNIQFHTEVKNIDSKIVSSSFMTKKGNYLNGKFNLSSDPSSIQNKNEKETSNKQPVSIHQICQILNFSIDEIQMLHDIQMLDITVQSFCEPGRYHITKILQEITQMSCDSIALLVEESFQAMQK